MKCTVLKNFTYSADGVNATEAKEGDRIDIPDALVPGLAGEGFVGELEDAGALTDPAEGSPSPDAAGDSTDDPADDTTDEEADDSDDAPESGLDEELQTLQEIYKAKTGRAAHYTWDADKIREKLSELAD